MRGVAPLDAMDRKSVAPSQPSQSGSASQRPQMSGKVTKANQAKEKLVTQSLRANFICGSPTVLV